jgi:flagellar motor switch protein FliG
MSTAPQATSSSPLREAAIVVASLGEDLAREVCSQLPRSQALALGDELAGLQGVSGAELNSAVAGFVGRLETSEAMGGAAFARSVLGGAASYAGVPGPSLERGDLDTLSRLSSLDPELLWRIVEQERPQVLAALLTQLSAAKAAQLLAHLDDQTAAAIARRAARMSAPAPGAMQALADALELELRAARSNSDGSPEVSVQFVVDLIGSMPPERGKQMLQALRDSDQELGDSVAEKVFTFDDIMLMSDRDLQIVLRAVDMGVLVMAVKGASAEMRERLKQNLSQRARERLEEEVDLLGAVPLSQVHDARRQMCNNARELFESGEIGLSSAAEEYVE